MHALGQVASVHARARDLTPTPLVRALNAQLPADVRVLSAEEAPPRSTRASTRAAKTYRYRIWNGDVLSPFERALRVARAAAALDVEAMRGGRALLEGRHDFAAFQAAGSDVATTEREIVARSRRGPADDPAIAVRRRDSIVYEVTRRRFLRHMVRAIVGTLVEVGRGAPAGRRGWRDVLASRDRARGGPDGAGRRACFWCASSTACLR